MLTLSSNLMTWQFWLLTVFVLASGHLEPAVALSIPDGPTDFNLVRDDASLPTTCNDSTRGHNPWED